MSIGRIVVTECDHDAFAEEEHVAAQCDFDFRVEQSTADTLIDNCRDANGLLVQYANITGRVLDELPNVAVVVRYGVGFDTVDVPAATARGVAVCNVPDYGTEAVSDHAIALAITAARGISTLHEGVRAGRYDLNAASPIFQFRNQVFGVLGLGRIGSAVARKARALGFRVIGHDIVAEAGTQYNGCEAVSFDNLLQSSDVISVHVPLDESTRYLVGHKQISQMKPGSILINTARGGIIDTNAVVDALAERHLAAVGFDCHETEPVPPSHPLTAFPQAILTPHVAWYSEESYGELKRRTMRAATDVLTGVRPAGLLNPEVFDSTAFHQRLDRMRRAHS
ncbi:MAG: C-terminal binding protein [Actinomycetaceae bacterium]|nr:C-terminal binding protein [Actinomycetaceae bacterium]